MTNKNVMFLSFSFCKTDRRHVKHRKFVTYRIIRNEDSCSKEFEYLPYGLHLRALIPKNLLINLAQHLIIQPFPCSDSFQAHPSTLPLRKFSQYDSCSPRPTRHSISMISKTSTITEPYTIQIPTKIIQVVMSYENSFHILQRNQCFQDSRIHWWTSYGLLELTNNFSIVQASDFWDWYMEESKRCGSLSWKTRASEIIVPPMFILLVSPATN